MFVFRSGTASASRTPLNYDCMLLPNPLALAFSILSQYSDYYWLDCALVLFHTWAHAPPAHLHSQLAHLTPLSRFPVHFHCLGLFEPLSLISGALRGPCRLTCHALFSCPHPVPCFLPCPLAVPPILISTLLSLFSCSPFHSLALSIALVDICTPACGLCLVPTPHDTRAACRHRTPNYVPAFPSPWSTSAHWMCDRCMPACGLGLVPTLHDAHAALMRGETRWPAQGTQLQPNQTPNLNTHTSTQTHKCEA